LKQSTEFRLYIIAMTSASIFEQHQRRHQPLQPSPASVRATSGLQIIQLPPPPAAGGRRPPISKTPTALSPRLRVKANCNASEVQMKGEGCEWGVG
jgi:hypothetical protein